jgi:hypothetical protein
MIETSLGYGAAHRSGSTFAKHDLRHSSNSLKIDG